MEQNISTAQREYFKRPKDERFQSLEALVENAQEAKEIPPSGPITFVPSRPSLPNHLMAARTSESPRLPAWLASPITHSDRLAVHSRCQPTTSEHYLSALRLTV